MSRSFDGTDDAVSFADRFNMGTSDWSVCCWFNSSSLVGTRTLVRKGDGASPAPTWFLRTSGANLNGILFLSGASNISITGSVTLTTGKWYHAAITYDRDGVMSLYLNGVSDATPVDISSGSAWNITTTDHGGIGAFFDGTPGNILEEFSGKIDQPQIFRRCLSQSEIIQLVLYPGSRPGNGHLLHHIYRGVSPEPDYSGNGNNGTVSGTTLSLDNPPINGIFTVPKPELIHVF